MTHAVLYGIKMTPPKKLGDEGWYEVIDTFKADKDLKPKTPSGEKCFGFLGFFIACGHYAEDGVPALDEPMPLSEIASGPTKYRKRYSKAVSAWFRFAAHVEEKHGIELPAPGLWLVETEIA
jgi:hypothetical protein